MDNKSFCLNINKLRKSKGKMYGSLRHFFINDVHWVLNYRGDAPLIQYHAGNEKRILQIDGDLFYILEVKWHNIKYENEVFDSFFLEIKEALNFINILLYEDMELEYVLAEGDDPSQDQDYYLHYEGNNTEGFERLLTKVENEQEIVEGDIVGL